MSVCGTEDIGPDLAARISDIQRKKLDAGPLVRSGPIDNITIATFVCIVTDINGAGDVNDTLIYNQIQVLNDDFAASGSVFQFDLRQITRFQQLNALTVNLTTYINDLGLSCRRGSKDSLNLFVVPNIESYVITNSVVVGRTFNFFQSGNLHTDGVYIRNLNLAGGGDAPYDLGVTAVHETGHWLGLIHPFQALPPFDTDPCNPLNPNDYIDDTPQMFSSSIDIQGCPVNRDSCPNDPGLDPTDNYMDYGTQYDSSGQICKTTFTPEQVSRMADVWEYYRNQNDICTANEIQFELQIRFDNYPNETSWDLKFANGTLVHDSTEDQFGGYGTLYGASNYAGMNMSITTCLPRAAYVFDIYDSEGDGIASPGYFRVTVDGHVKAYGTQSAFYVRTVDFGPYFYSTPAPSSMPSNSLIPSTFPSISPSSVPSTSPTMLPSLEPSASPSVPPSLSPSTIPSTAPSSTQPSFSPSTITSSVPSSQPSKPDSSKPTSAPTASKSGRPPVAIPVQPTQTPEKNQTATVAPSPATSLQSDGPSGAPSLVPSVGSKKQTVSPTTPITKATAPPTTQPTNKATPPPTTQPTKTSPPPTTQPTKTTPPPTTQPTKTTQPPTTHPTSPPTHPSSHPPTRAPTIPVPIPVISTSRPTTAPPTRLPTVATPTTTSLQTITLTSVTMELGGAGTTLSGPAEASWNQATVDQIVNQVYSTWPGVQNVVVIVIITKQVVQYRGRRELIALERGLAPQPVLALTFKTKISVKAPTAVAQPHVTKLVGDAFNNGRSQQYVAALARTGEPLLSRVSGVAVATTASTTSSTTSAATTSLTNARPESRPVSSSSHGGGSGGGKKKGMAKTPKDAGKGAKDGSIPTPGNTISSSSQQRDHSSPATATNAAKTMTKGAKRRSFPTPGTTTSSSSSSTQQRAINKRKRRHQGFRGPRPV